MATVRKRGAGYQIRVSCGYSAEGRQVMRSMTYRPPEDMPPRRVEKEVARQAVLFEERVREREGAECRLKLGEFAKIWFENYADKQLKPRTAARYRELFARIERELGHLRLEGIGARQLLDFYALLSEREPRGDVRFTSKNFADVLRAERLSQAEFARRAGVSAKTVQACAAGRGVARKSADRISAALAGVNFSPVGKRAGLSARTVRAHHRLISSMLGTAVRWQLIAANPCDRVAPPRVVRDEEKFLDVDRAADLVRALSGEPIKWRAIVMLLLYTGMRRGELCGLDWQDIDFERRTVRISRSGLYLAGRGVFVDSPKTASSVREVRVPEELLELLSLYREGTTGRGRVFTAADGSPIHPDSVSRRFRNFARRNGFAGLHLHSLRHTNATLLIAAGTDLRTVSSRLGHASISTTGNIYAHAIRSADDAAVEALVKILNPPRDVTDK